MSDAFVPLVPSKSKPREAAPGPASASAPSNGLSENFVQTTLATLKSSSAESDQCAKPIVTLKKEGNTVTGIRVECGCGRVLELACVY